MKEVELFATRLQQTFIKPESYGPTLAESSFHGPSVMEALEYVEFVEASRIV